MHRFFNIGIILILLVLGYFYENSLKLDQANFQKSTSTPDLIQSPSPLNRAGIAQPNSLASLSPSPAFSLRPPAIGSSPSPSASNKSRYETDLKTKEERLEKVKSEIYDTQQDTTIERALDQAYQYVRIQEQELQNLQAQRADDFNQALLDARQEAGVGAVSQAVSDQNLSSLSEKLGEQKRRLEQSQSIYDQLSQKGFESDELVAARKTWQNELNSFQKLNEEYQNALLEKQVQSSAEDSDQQMTRMDQMNLIDLRYEDAFKQTLQTYDSLAKQVEELQQKKIEKEKRLQDLEQSYAQAQNEYEALKASVKNLDVRTPS